MTLRLVTASACTALLLTGCAVTIGPSSTSASTEPASPEQPASPAQSVSPVSTQSPSPAQQTAQERTWAHEVVESATRPAEATVAQLKGTNDTYLNSTSLWVGCDGATNEVVLAVNGQYKRLFGHLGLRADVPAGLVVHTLVLIDGQPVQNVQLDSDDPGAVEVNVALADARQVTFQSQAVQGKCTASDESYAVLADGYVE